MKVNSTTFGFFFVNNFKIAKCWLILQKSFTVGFTKNVQLNLCHVSQHTLHVAILK